MPPVGRITGPAKATRKYGPIAGQLAQEEFAPQFADVDARAKTRAQNIGYFNAVLIDALGPYIQAAREAGAKQGSVAAQLGEEFAGFANNARGLGAAQAAHANLQPMFLFKQANLDRMLSEAQAGQDRRALDAAMAARRGEILSGLVDQLFQVQTQRFAQDLANREFGLSEDKFSADERERKFRRKLDKRLARLSEEQQQWAQDLALAEYGAESLDDLTAKQAARILREAEARDRDSKKGKEKGNPKVKRRKAARAAVYDAAAPAFADALEEASKTPNPEYDPDLSPTELEGIPEFIEDEPTVRDAFNAFVAAWGNLARQTLNRTPMTAGALKGTLLNAMKDAGWKVRPSDDILDPFIRGWLRTNGVEGELPE